MINIRGLTKFSLIDYPGHLSSIIHVGGCNFNCEYCYNKEINNNPKIEKDKVIKFLKTRIGMIDGVVITGGEPTIQNGLIDIIKEIRGVGFKVKLDTNGYRPDVLFDLLELNLLNYIAMDIKCDIENYSKIVGMDIDTEIIKKSIDIIKKSNIDHEFRTTVWEEMLSVESIKEIIKLIGNSKYYIQCCELPRHKWPSSNLKGA